MQLMASAFDDKSFPRSLPKHANVFIVSNDILELAIRAFIVSARCACYIQSGHKASGRRLSNNEQELRRIFAFGHLVSFDYDS
jgi:hypothetical protein